MATATTSRRQSITFRMTVAVCGLLLVFQVVLAVLVFNYFKAEFTKNISSQQLSLLTVAAQSIDHKLDASRRMVDDVARTVPAEALTDSDAAQRYLDSRPGTRSYFDNGIFLFSLQGQLIAESPYRPKRRGRDISFRDYYKQTIATGLPCISDPFVSTHNPGAPTVIFTAPVRDARGKMIAILGGGLNLQAGNFLGSLSQVRVANSGYMFLTTSKRTLVMHPDRSKILGSATNSDLSRKLAKALDGFAGTEETVNSDGIRYLTTFKRLGMTDWIVGINYPVKDAYAPIWRVQKYFLVFNLLGTLFFVVAIRMVMKRFTDTLVKFAEHVRTISTKKGPERLFAAVSNDEVGTVVAAFNEMLQNVDQKNDILVHVSTHDALTGLYNRSYFDSELERLRRGRITPISIVVADIDGLKECNDTAGHAAGDELIRSAGRLLLETFRAEDIVARIGGDEFGILLPGLDLKNAEMTVERVRNSIAEQHAGGPGCRLSISLGCAACDNPLELEAVFNIADRRMYQDKMSKKQCTT